MNEAEIQAIVVRLQSALETKVIAGTIVLNLNQGKLASVKIETYQRIDGEKPLTNR